VHDEADTLAATRMEKKLDLERARLQTEYPEAEIEVWAMDEHRLGLKPVQRRVWAQQAEPPIAAVKWRFQWLWLYGCVHPLVWGNILVDSTESQYRVIQPRRKQILHNILARVRTSVSFSFSIELVGRRA
jgi:hypothetical protein